MSITGHETAEIFRRYAGLVDPEEQKAAFAAREAFPKAEKAERNKESNVAKLPPR